MKERLKIWVEKLVDNPAYGTNKLVEKEVNRSRQRKVGTGKAIT
jgi:hypothetical protein